MDLSTQNFYEIPSSIEISQIQPNFTNLFQQSFSSQNSTKDPEQMYSSCLCQNQLAQILNQIQNLYTKAANFKIQMHLWNLIRMEYIFKKKKLQLEQNQTTYEEIYQKMVQCFQKKVQNCSGNHTKQIKSLQKQFDVTINKFQLNYIQYTNVTSSFEVRTRVLSEKELKLLAQELVVLRKKSSIYQYANYKYRKSNLKTLQQLKQLHKQEIMKIQKIHESLIMYVIKVEKVDMGKELQNNLKSFRRLFQQTIISIDNLINKVK